MYLTDQARNSYYNMKCTVMEKRLNDPESDVSWFMKSELSETYKRFCLLHPIWSF